ncbi:MAG: 4-alpha-glucanotransferase [Coprobacillus sp.]|nr:4-alpha-glucanotransferase [Coprobacillus sp.]
MKNTNVGVLLPVSSLPSHYGMGDFGYDCYQFIDWLKKNHYKYWQILPLNPLGPGNSPYMSTCSTAIDYRYVSLELLYEDGYLNEKPLFLPNTDSVNFEYVGEYKEQFLREAYHNFIAHHPFGMKRFKISHPWVRQYATFEFFKRRNGNKAWSEWKRADRDYFLHHTLPPKEEDIEFFIFVQMVALEQWKHVLNYAKKKGIAIISDVPFYVGYDSTECWLHREQFSFDRFGRQTEVGGVPPDAFSDAGQLWGSPIYNFDVMKRDGYQLLVDRIGYLGTLCDYLRLDHFRAFDTYYVIPAGRSDAKVGTWKIGPRDEFFKKLYAKYPKTKLIAEDLGDLVHTVIELRDRLKLHGMYIMEFTIFDDKVKSSKDLIVYPGTHDNETLWGWYNNLTEEQYKYLMKKLGSDRRHLYNNVFKYMYTAPSYMTIFQLQDFLKLDNSARTNCPGTVGYPNWSWKLKDWSWTKEVVYPKKHWRVE